MSVSELNAAPSATSAALSWAKFSMIPLWISATRPDGSVCGWELASLGSPCVAQRVWPRPEVPGSGVSAPSRLASLPERFTTASGAPGRPTTTPAESYPRYSSVRSPSTRTGSACSGPV